MKPNRQIIIIGFLIVVLFLWIFKNVSSFTELAPVQPGFKDSRNISQVDQYTSRGRDTQYVCNNIDNRVIPSGKLPGSTIILTEGEKQQLLIRFIDNAPEII